MTPIVCLIFTLLIKVIAEGRLTPALSFSLPIPYVYNVPYNYIYGRFNPLLNRTVALDFQSCLQWYMYDFEGANFEDQDFVGKFVFFDFSFKNLYVENGMIENVLPPWEIVKELYYCRRKGYMPQFKRPNASLTINQHMFQTLKELNKYKMNNKSREVPHLDWLPDGAVTFYEANRNNLSLKLQINDLKVNQYHRVNGITRYLIPDAKEHLKNKTKKVSYKNVPL